MSIVIKTGTITEDGLDIRGVVPVRNGMLLERTEDPASFSAHSDVIQCMACCHTLNWLDGQLVGDPLEMKMFEASGWIYEQTGSNSNDPAHRKGLVATFKPGFSSPHVCKFHNTSHYFPYSSEFASFHENIWKYLLVPLFHS